jgi:predicted RNA binding protein YcfA (HicA-like mRNA interferase family)
MNKLPVLSGRQVIAALERLGFVAVRQKGSHVIMRKGELGTVIPLHDPVKTGTLAGILRQAQISRDAFMAALQ